MKLSDRPTSRILAAPTLAVAIVLAACSTPVPTHETPGWGTLADSVRTELLAIPAEPTPTAGGATDSVDLIAGLTMSSPNAVTTLWVDLDVGACFLWPYDEADNLLDEVAMVPCDEPHHGELFAVGKVKAEAYSEVEVSTEVDARCEEAFPGYVGIGYLESVYYYAYSYPTEVSWDAGARGWRCYVYETDYENSGSVHGAAR